MLRVADMLVGKPLLYLIALEQHPGRADAITELGYDARTPSEFGIGAHYVNLRDERNSGRYGPYLPPDDIDEAYNEPAPDPGGDGFWRNLDNQLDRAVTQGFAYVELDNLDTYDVAIAEQCFDHCAQRNLKVFVKNPLLVQGSREALLRHPAAVLVVVEEECGDPLAMDALRVRAGKLNMPIRFVSYGTIDEWAQDCAATIREHGMLDMGVTHSPHGEYASSEDILLPTAPPATGERPTVTITTTGDIDLIVNGIPMR